MRDIVWPGGALRLSERTHIMGIVNVTPDSFSDGGRFLDPADAVAYGQLLAEEGADILDIGGESTRPGADPVDADDEIARVVPVIEQLAKTVDIPLSIDTSKAVVARAALDAGATIINDVSAGRFDPPIMTLAGEREVPLILMHMLGEPRTMQLDPIYDDVVADIRSFLVERAQVAIDSGVPPERIVIDPGIGFGKTPAHNLTLVKRLRDMTLPGYPVLVGASRKSFIGLTLDVPVDERLEGTLATTALAVWNGTAIVRAHDVRANLRIARMVDAVARAGER